MTAFAVAERLELSPSAATDVCKEESASFPVMNWCFKTHKMHNCTGVSPWCSLANAQRRGLSDRSAVSRRSVNFERPFGSMCRGLSENRRKRV
jgi:hypothetical protein